MFLDLDPSGQAGPVIPRQHRHRSLGQDLTGVHLGDHQVGGAATEANASCQGLTHRIKAPKAGQQRRVDVQQPLRKSLYQHRSDNAHPARHHHQVHLFVLQGSDQGAIKILPGGMKLVIEKLGGNPESHGPATGAAIGAVDNQQLNAGCQWPLAAGCYQCLKIAPGPGGHNPKPEPAMVLGPDLWQWPLKALLRLAIFFNTRHLQDIKPMSHLSILPTVLRDTDILQQALASLGLNSEPGGELVGFAGERQQVAISVQLDGGQKLGWQRNADGRLSLVGDLQLLSRSLTLPILLGRITRAYAARQALHEASMSLPTALLEFHG